MSEKLQIRFYITGAVTMAMGTLLAWDYFHGGVPVHHIFAQKDMPGFSNWWGLLLIPLLTWLLVYRIQKRMSITNFDHFSLSKTPRNILYGFCSALLFGILLSVFFSFGSSDVPFYMLVGLLATALFYPVYRAECFLGFVLGMVITFGGVIPVIIISVLSLMGAVLYLVVRPVILFMVKKIGNLGSAKR